jgi:5'-methylthioadenosine phosphorylase
MSDMKVGIIGGSGLDNPDFIEHVREKNVTTPYGLPSDTLKVGVIRGVDTVLLSRHGRNHSIMPGNVNFRANIHALREEGCTHILASTACGSLREEIQPGHLIFPGQFIDRTTRRASTFYDRDQVCHISMEEPFCPHLRVLLHECAQRLGIAHHCDSTLITIEGPRFSTRAESRMFRMWGADIINMSTVPEVVLAREAGICYQVVAMSTDYDCFMTSKENVSWEQIARIMAGNIDNVIRLFLDVIGKIDYGDCRCREAIDSALVE